LLWGICRDILQITDQHVRMKEKLKGMTITSRLNA
jgi:hypothetical protein